MTMRRLLYLLISLIINNAQAMEPVQQEQAPITAIITSITNNSHIPYKVIIGALHTTKTAFKLPAGKTTDINQQIPLTATSPDPQPLITSPWQSIVIHNDLTNAKVAYLNFNYLPATKQAEVILRIYVGNQAGPVIARKTLQSERLREPHPKFAYGITIRLNKLIDVSTVDIKKIRPQE